MARPKPAFALTDEQRRELERIVRAPTSPKKFVRRARVALLAAAGHDNAAIAAELHTSRVTVGLWRQRFLDAGLAGLAEAARPGRPVALDPKKARRALAEVMFPPKHRERWSCRAMARHLGVSKDAVQRLWAANDLKPHLHRPGPFASEPRCAQKFWDVIGLYLDPPARALVLCCDGKGQVRPLKQAVSGWRSGPGGIATSTRDDYHHGTVPLFAALHYLNGKILAERAPRHRPQQWLAFLKGIAAEVAPDVDVHLIVDNCAAHKHPKVLDWAARHPRFHLHVAPTNASWLTTVERFLRDRARDVLLPGSFAGATGLTDAIWRHLVERNLHPRSYEWQAGGSRRLNRVQRGRGAPP